MKTLRKCKSCEKEIETFRVARIGLCWYNSNGTIGEGKSCLTVFDGAGPVCKRCFIKVIDYLRSKIETGEALVPAPKKRFKVIAGGKN